MILLGALTAGICAFFAAGLATGNAPRIGFKTGDAGKPEIGKWTLWLTQAGLEISPLHYLGALVAVGAIVFGIVSALTATPVVAFAPAVAAAVIPHAFVSKRRMTNLAKTQQAWPDAIRELIASIESNASLQNALVQLSTKGPEPLRVAFERFPSLAATLGVVPALEAIRERVADPTSDRVIEVLILAHERGGGIVTDILRDLAAATTDDLQLQEEIESSRLEQRINARAVFVLPWVVLVLLVSANPQFRTFYQSPTGLVVVLIGFVVSMTGMLLVGKLFKDSPEPRVFGGSAVTVSSAVIAEDDL